MLSAALLYMHRGYFAKAMHDHPEDPLSGRYGRSVLCAHRSASSFVALVKSLWSQHKALTERNWFLFTHVFSCAVSTASSVLFEMGYLNGIAVYPRRLS